MKFKEAVLLLLGFVLAVLIGTEILIFFNQYFSAWIFGPFISASIMAICLEVLYKKKEKNIKLISRPDVPKKSNKCPQMTEHEMRAYKVPWFDNICELAEFIQSLLELEHTYGTAAYSMSLAATAAFNFIANNEGCTGFQASCADLDFIRRTRRLKGPFKLLDYSKMLYPQYRNEFYFQEINKGTWEFLEKEAKKLLYTTYLRHKKFRLNEKLYRRFDFTARNGGHSHYEGVKHPPHRAVINHWMTIASGRPPFFCKIVD